MIGSVTLFLILLTYNSSEAKTSLSTAFLSQWVCAMAADPFAIAGSLGLAAGLIGFVASTVEKAAGQFNTANHAHLRLQEYQGSLNTCQRRVEAWAQQWHDHEEVTKEDASFLWGPEGLGEVEQLKTNILEEQGDLLKLLYGRSWSNTYGQETAVHWAGILQGQENALRRHHPAPPAPSDSKSKDIYTRISTALWKNNLLSTSVDRLKGLVENLETTSRLHFHKAQSQKSADHHRQPSNEEIGIVIKQHHRMRHLAHALSVAYQNLRPSAGSCELLFTDFDKAEICRLEMQNELVLTFLIVSDIDDRLHSTFILTWQTRSIRPCWKQATDIHIAAWTSSIPWTASTIASSMTKLKGCCDPNRKQVIWLQEATR
jgi:hypothetical protein